jgi:hypothetical protein
MTAGVEDSRGVVQVEAGSVADAALFGMGCSAGDRLSIRVAVDLDTYGRVAELSRTSGVTLEGAASVLLARAAIRQQVAAQRQAIAVKTRWVTTPSTYLAGSGEPGTTSTPGRICDDVQSGDPGRSSPCFDVSPVRPTEEGDVHE